MNVKVAKPSASYKVVAETFGERYMAISTLYNYILHDRSIGCYIPLYIYMYISGFLDEVLSPCLISTLGDQGEVCMILPLLKG